MIFLSLFLAFFKIGAFTFGGGYAMLPLIQDEVLHHGWMDESTLIGFIAISESTPGPFAINIATYVGRIVGGLPGALSATLGVVTPSFVVIMLVSRFYKRYRDARPVVGAMTGLKSAVPGLIAAALVSMAGTVLFPAGLSLAAFTPAFFVSLGIFLIAAALSFVKKIPPIVLILFCAMLGVGAGFLLGLPV